jgi:hypothetical protein
MTNKDIIRLFLIIIAILFISILIGDLIITPMVIYHKLLVRFFGIFFIFLAIFLLSMKIYTNYQFLVLHSSGQINFIKVFKKTITETANQLFKKAGNIFLFLAFLLVIGSITILVIWLNGNLIKIQGG